jgi:hypothetical protein
VGRLTVVLLSVALAGCGHAGRTEGPTARDSAEAQHATTATGAAGRTSTTEADSKTDSDEDNDNPTSSYYDSDDNVVLSYGHAANTTDMRAIATVIKRYYAAAAAGDGREGCSLLYSILIETAPEDLSQTPKEGETCLEAMSSFFKRDHRQFKADTVGIGVTRARVKGDSGLALVRLGSRERRVLVHRENGVWKLGTLLDIGVP